MDQEITHEIMKITPAKAKGWMETSKFENRRLDDSSVEKISRDIKKGKWVFDGNAIRFDSNGNVIDGQHRLYAIIKAGKAVESVVVRNLKDEAKLIIDSGKSRSNADILHLVGYKNTSRLASVCRLNIGYKQCDGDMWIWATRKNGERLSSTELMEEAKTNDELSKAVYEIKKLKYVSNLFGPALAIFSYYLFYQRDAIATYNFFLGLEHGVDLKADSPVLVLRNHFGVKALQFRGTRGGGGPKYTAYKLAIIIKCWNAYRQNKPMKYLRYSETEPYPSPI